MIPWKIKTEAGHTFQTIGRSPIWQEAGLVFRSKAGLDAEGWTWASAKASVRLHPYALTRNA
jgi:hypothetical protein